MSSAQVFNGEPHMKGNWLRILLFGIGMCCLFGHPAAAYASWQIDDTVVEYLDPPSFNLETGSSTIGLAAYSESGTHLSVTAYASGTVSEDDPYDASPPQATGRADVEVSRHYVQLGTSTLEVVCNPATSCTASNDSTDNSMQAKCEANVPTGLMSAGSIYSYAQKGGGWGSGPQTGGDGETDDWFLTSTTTLLYEIDARGTAYPASGGTGTCTYACTAVISYSQ